MSLFLFLCLIIQAFVGTLPKPEHLEIFPFMPREDLFVSLITCPSLAS